MHFGENAFFFEGEGGGSVVDSGFGPFIFSYVILLFLLVLPKIKLRALNF